MPENARPGSRSLRILVVNRDLPPADRDSGSLRLFRIIELMLAQGHSVTVLGKDGVMQEGAFEALIQLGVERAIPIDVEFLRGNIGSAAPELLAHWPQGGLAQFLRHGRFDVAWISFHRIAEYYMPILRKLSPATKIIVDSVDVNSVRERRGAELSGDRIALLLAEQTRQSELPVYGSADANIAVSEVEAGYLRELAPNVPVHVLSNIHAVPAETTPLEGRRGLIFVANFDHRPNVDAALWFRSACWPLVKAALPDARLTFAGAFPPPEVQALAAQDVTVTGWVPSLTPYLNQTRVSIAPLRFGAGVKGKIGEAMAAGLPVVTTSIGSEGMGLVDGVHALVADTPEEFAAAVVRLSSDDSLWNQLADAARQLLAHTFDEATAAAKLSQTLAAVIADRWQVQWNAPWLRDALGAYAERFPPGSPARLVVTFGADTNDTDNAVGAITRAAAELGIDLDQTADVEVTAWREDMPSPARTVFWQPSTADPQHDAHNRAFAVGTIATADFIPWVRVLADSFADHNPGIRFVVLLLDEHDPASLRADDRFEIVKPADVGLLEPEFSWMQTIYVPQKLVCATKPWLLSYLLEKHEAALYIDNDMLVSGELTDVGALAREHGLVLTPHALEPFPDDGMFPTDDTYLEYGQFNGGFVATGREEHGFLDFWKSKLRRDCTEHTELDPYRVGDQRWLDLAVSYFPFHVLRDPGVNVGYWNLGPRRVTSEPTGDSVNGRPLRLMHFSGFDPASPQIYSRHVGRPRTELSAPAVLDLLAQYARRLTEAGWRSFPADDANVAGIKLTKVVRRAIREALVSAEALGLAPQAGPSDGRVLVSWLRSPIPAGTLSWYLWGLRASQPRVSATFPEVAGSDAGAYLNWAVNDPGAREWVPSVLVPQRPAS